MSADHHRVVSYRKLYHTDKEDFSGHLLRLDKASRRMRFGHVVSNAFIRTYAEVSSSLGGVVHGCYVDGTLRAAGELRPVSDLMPRMAEAAFSVEALFQNAGIGTTLLRHVVRSAQNRGISTLVMYCLIENGRMRALAAKQRAVVKIEDGGITGKVLAPSPSPYSLIRETLTDAFSHFEIAMDAVAGRGPKR